MSYRASRVYLGNNPVIKPTGHFEAVDKDGYSITCKYDDSFMISEKAETCASTYIGGAVLGAYSMIRHQSHDINTVYLYQIDTKPDIDVSWWTNQDFIWLQEVRYRKPVQAKYIGSYTYTSKDREKFNSLYELLSEDFAPNVHEYNLLKRKIKDLAQYLKQKSMELKSSPPNPKISHRQANLIKMPKRKTCPGAVKL